MDHPGVGVRARRLPEPVRTTVMDATAATLTRNLYARCAYYRDTCDIPAEVNHTHNRIEVQAGYVGTITMPASLGARVRQAMLDQRLDVGPIIGHPRSDRWSILVQPDLEQDVPLFGELFARNVIVAPIGAEIALPGSTDVHGDRYRYWINPPTSGYRPSGASVVDLIRTVSTKSHIDTETREFT